MSKKNKEFLSKESMKDAFNTFYNGCTQSHARFKSWEHCKNVFNQAYDSVKNNVYKAEKIPFDVLDNLCLNLGFYLASWGMMRGSTDLLQRDYKIHEKAIPVILQYADLNNLSLAEIKKEKTLKKIFDLKNDLRNAYLNDVDNHLDSMSDILTTKIIMGTLGIVPAYDDFLKKALRYYDISNASGGFTNNSMKNLCTFFLEEANHALLVECQEKMNNATSVYYSEMKIIDMILWELGGLLK